MNPRKDLATPLAALQDALGPTRGRKYWRTLEELADSEPFRQLIEQEFPVQADIWPDSLDRRRFLLLMGGALALGGLTGCSVRPAAPQEIVPYVRQPELLVPGRPLFFATAMTLGGVGVGLLAESHLGRPTKIEGNPDHPTSLGATDRFHQASILDLYDPDRSQTVTILGQTTTWDAALGQVRVKGIPSLRQAMVEQRKRRGKGLRLLSETVVSPTLHRLIGELRDPKRNFPEARWHQYEPLANDAAHRAARSAFGQPVGTRYDFTKADVVVSLDADFLGCGSAGVRYAADFMSRRRLHDTTADAAAKATMNRLYVIEPTVTCTGAKADHRLALRAGEVEAFARALAARLGVLKGGTGEAHTQWADAVARDLQKHPGRSLVLAGSRQPEAVHLLVHAINDRLRNVGQTIIHTQPVEAEPVDHRESLRELADDMAKGQVEVLLILGGNPVYTAPADLDFTARMEKVPFRVHLSDYQDETSRQCHWHLPAAHYLESWGDTRAHDGTATIVQPLIAPLYQGRSASELLAGLARQVPTPGLQLVRETWRRHWESHGRSGQFDDFWQTALHDGVVPDTELPPKTVTLNPRWQSDLQAAAAAGPGYEIVFEPDPTIFDGRFANNPWLQECPKPITTLTWDNAAIMSPATAAKEGLAIGHYAHGGEHGGYEVPVVELDLDGRKVEAPVWIMPGHADDCITVSLGYGRDHAGRVGGDPGNRVGFNAYTLRTSAHPGFAPGLALRKTSRRYQLACTQGHHLMEGREPVRVGTLANYRQHPDFAGQKEREEEHAETLRSRKPLTLYNPQPPAPHRWGMAIDLTACTGCKSCVIACQAENNIPIVGKEQVLHGREMHWLRIDRYVGGTFEEPGEFHFQPVPCMHCEHAPCEYVCPTAATVHSADGLNDMVYQRCVGTRFCSNNCPYKVRRFNFLFYADYATASKRLQYNPDVTVRSRGVMEKCTYCVQRLRNADIDAQKEGRPIGKDREGRPIKNEVMTACQAACPAGAIVFGDLNDPSSDVSHWKNTPLNYGLLADLNTSPRTTYLAAVRNPNPELER